ncbi:MAG TPA: efflux RND transporter periplasmic adaptor subunit [Ktedonobacteraceae bacterium]|nr:efflux RND transporter periplasmic adaptor subunit [Ktedonobacteraceae bacterium]
MVMQKTTRHSQFEPIPGLVHFANRPSSPAVSDTSWTRSQDSLKPLFSRQQFKEAGAILDSLPSAEDPVTPTPPFLVPDSQPSLPQAPESRGTQGLKRLQRVEETPAPLSDSIKAPLMLPLPATMPEVKPVAEQPLQVAEMTPQFKEPSRLLKDRRALVSGITCAVIVLGALAFSIWNFVSASTPSVTLYQVGSQSVMQPIGGTGTVFPLQHFDLSYPNNERVEAVLVKVGDHVSHNQGLIQLDPTALNDQVKQAYSALQAAKADLDTASLSGTYFQISSAQQNYDALKQRYDVLVEDTSTSTLHNATLIAPLAGVVTNIAVNPGDLVPANSKLLTIMDESRVLIHLEVPLSNLGQITVGQQASVNPTSVPGNTFTGVVKTIIPRADPQSDTFEVWIEVKNKNLALLPGMSVFAHIHSQERTLILPRLAALNTNHDMLVFVVRDKRARLQKVHVVGRDVSRLFVDAGLIPGDQVVLIGLSQLHDGQIVHVSQVETRI